MCVSTHIYKDIFASSVCSWRKSAPEQFQSKWKVCMRSATLRFSPLKQVHHTAMQHEPVYRPAYDARAGVHACIRAMRARDAMTCVRSCVHVRVLRTVPELALAQVAMVKVAFLAAHRKICHIALMCA